MKVLSYMLVKCHDDGAGRYNRGDVVSIRDINRPLGSGEKPPFVYVVYTDKPVEELKEYLEPDGEWEGIGSLRPAFKVISKRKIAIDIDAIPDIKTKLDTDGIIDVKYAKFNKARKVK